LDVVGKDADDVGKDVDDVGKDADDVGKAIPTDGRTAIDIDHDEFIRSFVGINDDKSDDYYEIDQICRRNR